MEDKVRNVCRIARAVAGQTQERWAESIDVSVESVRLYESGRVAEVSGHQIICYWHLLNKSRVASSLLPEVEQLPLEQAVLRLLRRMKSFFDRHRDDALMEIAEDGKVELREREDFGLILTELEAIVQAAMALRFAEGREVNEREL